MPEVLQKTNKLLHMEELSFTQLKKKRKHIGFRVSEDEKDLLIRFCHKKQISIADFMRYAIQKVINDKQNI